MGTFANKRHEDLDIKGRANQLLAEKKEVARAVPARFVDFLKGDLANEIGIDLVDKKLATQMRTASDAAAFKTWLTYIAERVADSFAEGGSMGSGGVMLHSECRRRVTN